MTARLAAKYQVVADRITENYQDLIRNRDRGDALQTAAIAIMSILVAGLVVGAITVAIRSRTGQIK